MGPTKGDCVDRTKTDRVVSLMKMMGRLRHTVGGTRVTQMTCIKRVHELQPGSKCIDMFVKLVNGTGRMLCVHHRTKAWCCAAKVWIPFLGGEGQMTRESYMRAFGTADGG